MTKKSSRQNRIKGDVNITNGDIVGGDKTILHDDDDHPPEAVKSSRNKRVTRAKTRDIDGNLEVSGGDVVFGDKIIKFFQDSLNIYLFKDIKQLALFLAFLLFLSAAISGAYWYSKQPQKMTGNFNIAVAQFGEIQEDGSVVPSAKAQTIRNMLFNFMDSEYRASGLGLTVQVTQKNMPYIAEVAEAEKLVKRVNANIVIFGNISSQGNNQAEFYPRFYVPQQSDTDELTGQSELAHPIPFDIPLGPENKIHAELRIRTAILFNFTKTLIYFSGKDFDSASRAAQTAITAAEGLQKPFSGQEALYLLAARIQMSQGNNEEANRFLDQALDLNPNYARAYLARGNIFYSQALKANFDAGLLDRALTEYTRAYEAPNQPEGAYIPIKAHTTLGNVLVVRAQQTNDPILFSQAISHYLFVTEEYKRTKDPYLQGFAAVSYFGLGAAFERQGKKKKVKRLNITNKLTI